MTPRKNKLDDPPLSEQAHKQMMDLYRLADKSPNADLRQSALKMAEALMKHHQRQTARVQPWLILLLNVVLIAAVASLCRYAILQYSGAKAGALCGIYIGLYLALAGISLFMTDRLSQANLMKMFKPLINMKFPKWPFGKSGEKAG
jgi:hypothetical protein